MRGLLLILPVLLTACATRTLTENELAFADTVLGPAIDTEKVRIVKGAVVGLIPVTVQPRDRMGCREHLYPPITEPFEATYPAFARQNALYYTRQFWSEDFLAAYPEALDLDDAMRLAHELTHIWQWQNRRELGYRGVLAAFEHVQSEDPYQVEIDESRAFTDYGWEQQGAIIEEFVCCRVIDPEGKRTERLTELVRQVFPAAATRDLAENIRLPWEGAELDGICT